MKEFFKKIWEKIKAWAKLTVIPWFKQNWMQIVNVIVIIFAYIALYESGTTAEFLSGVWLLILIAYYFIWKLFGFGKLRKKNRPEPKPVGKKVPAKKAAKKK